VVTYSHVLKLQLKLVTATRTSIETNPLLFRFKVWSFFCSKTIERADEKDHTLNLFLHDIGTAMASDLNDYKIIKEGEAEILMHAKNEVFYNKTQVMKFVFLFYIF